MRKYKTARCILYREGRYLLADHTPQHRRYTQHRWRKRSQRKSGSKTADSIRWGLPGGHVEWREDPLEAARREVFEELNIHLADLIAAGDYVYKQRYHAVYAAHSEYTEFDLDFSELAEVRWFTRAEIAHLESFDQLHAGYELDAVTALEALQL